jgi:hypothetical protein
LSAAIFLGHLFDNGCQLGSNVHTDLCGETNEVRASMEVV